MLQLRGEENDGAAEAAIDAALSPSSMSGAARDILAHLDVAAVLDRRRTNARALRAALMGQGVPEGALFGDGEESRGATNSTLYALALRLDALPPSWPASHTPHHCAELLAAHGVFTPAFWPRLTHAVNWPNILALPIDQRYCPDQMPELARRVMQVLRAE